MHDCLNAIWTWLIKSVCEHISGLRLALAVPLMLLALPAHAVFDYDTLKLQEEDTVDEEQCKQAWPVSCEGGSGTLGCGGWNLLMDLAQSETLPGLQGTCSTGARIALSDRQRTQGQPVGAMFPGVVIFSQSGKSRDGKDYGGVVVIQLKLDDGSPQCFARYMFLDRRDLIKTGEKVEAGQRIGSIASDNMSPSKTWWRDNWPGVPPQLKVDIGCDEALANLPHFMPREAFTGGGPEDEDSCPLTKLRFPAPPFLYLSNTEHAQNRACQVNIRKDGRTSIAAVPQDDTEKDLKVRNAQVEVVKPRGVIKRKMTPVFSVFKEEDVRENLFGANRFRLSGNRLFRTHINYPGQTLLGCDNVQEILRGRSTGAGGMVSGQGGFGRSTRQSLPAEEVRELLNHCANQYLLGRAIFPNVHEQSTATESGMQRPLPARLKQYMKPEDREKYEELLESDATPSEIFNEMEMEIAGVYWRDTCQPLAMQKIHIEDYKVNELLTKSWKELLIDWPQERDLKPINRNAITPIDQNSYADYPYERIIDPSHPFSPRHIFAETERERYSNYNVQCAATPVDIILGTYGEEEPFDVYGPRDTAFHQCISCRIDLNEKKKACFPDPYSFTNSGGCQFAMMGRGQAQNGCSGDDGEAYSGPGHGKLSDAPWGGPTGHWTWANSLNDSITAGVQRYYQETGLWVPENLVKSMLYREGGGKGHTQQSNVRPEMGILYAFNGIFSVTAESRGLDYHKMLIPLACKSDGYRYLSPPGGGRFITTTPQCKEAVDYATYAAVKVIGEIASDDGARWGKPGPILCGFGWRGMAARYFSGHPDCGGFVDEFGNTCGDGSDADYLEGPSGVMYVWRELDKLAPGEPAVGGNNIGRQMGVKIGETGRVFGGRNGAAPSKPTGMDLVIATMKFRGQPYSQEPGRDDPKSNHADCSGLIAKGFQEAVGEPMKNTHVSTTIEIWATADRNANGAGGVYEWLSDSEKGIRISREEARRTPGAILTKGGKSSNYNGLGNNGHIGISTGDGFVFETASQEGHKAGCSSFDWNTWEDFFLMPSKYIDYDPERNKPIPGICDMENTSSRGICEYALPLNIRDKEDLEPPSYFEEYEFPEVEMPDPPSEKRGDKYDREIPGMVYEGAWRNCDNLPTAALRETCEKLNEEKASAVNSVIANPVTTMSGYSHPVPCSNGISAPFAPTVAAAQAAGYTIYGTHHGIDLLAEGIRDKIVNCGTGPEHANEGCGEYKPGETEFEPIFASAPGMVIKSEIRGPSFSGSGNHVTIQHPNGTKTWYLHLANICEEAMEGNTVEQGQVIGYMGNTGRSTGPHLHFEIRMPPAESRDDSVDPEQHIPPIDPGNPMCPEIRALRCGDVANLPTGPGTGKRLCADKPCSLQYDQADLVAHCAYPNDVGGCGPLGGFTQRGDKDSSDCCFNITKPVTPLNLLKLRPGYDREALKPDAINVDDEDQYIEGAWPGMRVNDGLSDGTKGEGGTATPNDANPGAPEGYTFYEHFRDHRPYMRWWDTGAESGNIVQDMADVAYNAGAYDTLVGVGIEKNSCGIGGWGDPNKLDGNTSWLELKMYQARAMHTYGLRCLARYEKVFKRGSAEDYVHRLAGGNFYTAFSGGSGAGMQALNLPLGWRGYASEPDPTHRFPYQSNYPGNDMSAQEGMVGGGLDYAIPGDILIWDEDVVGQKRLPHMAYVVRVDNATSRARYDSTGTGVELSNKRFFEDKPNTESPPSVTVTDYNHGRYPDTCGNTNWWASGPERIIYHGTLPETLLKDAERLEVKDTTCANPDLSSCVEPLWGAVKIYRPWKHIRD